MLIHLLSKFGGPAEVTTDQGAEFEGDFHQLLERWSIDHRRTHRNHPAATTLPVCARPLLWGAGATVSVPAAPSPGGAHRHDFRAASRWHGHALLVAAHFPVCCGPVSPVARAPGFLACVSRPKLSCCRCARCCASHYILLLALLIRSFS
jgi:hypothetical protein